MMTHWDAVALGHGCAVAAITRGPEGRELVVYGRGLDRELAAVALSESEIESLAALLRRYPRETRVVVLAGDEERDTRAGGRA